MKRLIFINVVKDKLRFAYDNSKFYNSHTVINCVNITNLKEAKHISAKKAIKEFSLEKALNYSIKYLLGILNSSLITWYFYNFQSEAFHFFSNYSIDNIEASSSAS